MKVSRIIALCLLIPLGGTAVVAVCLNAQPLPEPKDVPAPELPGPSTRFPVVIGNNFQSPANRSQHFRNPLDRETLQLINEELAADQEVKSLVAQFVEAPTDGKTAEVKKKLREKLVAIFAMQQKRRTAEIASIEERLARLKDISKKRETNKDAIVDRRLEQLTGGVDELGWEESNRGANRYPVEELNSDYVEPGPSTNNFGLPPTETPRSNNVPVPKLPRATTPSASPSPVTDE